MEEVVAGNYGHYQPEPGLNKPGVSFLPAI